MGDTILVEFSSSAISAIADAALLRNTIHHYVLLCNTIPAIANAAPYT